MNEKHNLSALSLQSRSANFLSAWHPVSLRRNWPGASISIVIALAATFVSTAYGGPQLLYALFFGLAFHFLSQDAVCQPGFNFCSHTLLRTGVALLGARVTFEQITWRRCMSLPGACHRGVRRQNLVSGAGITWLEAGADARL